MCNVEIDDFLHLVARECGTGTSLPLVNVDLEWPIYEEAPFKCRGCTDETMAVEPVPYGPWHISYVDEEQEDGEIEEKSSKKRKKKQERAQKRPRLDYDAPETTNLSFDLYEARPKLNYESYIEEGEIEEDGEIIQGEHIQESIQDTNDFSEPLPIDQLAYTVEEQEETEFDEYAWELREELRERERIERERRKKLDAEEEKIMMRESILLPL